MPFQQPANWAKTVTPLTIGLGIGLVLHFLRKSNLPYSGDNIHQFPHGGHYRDGTKSITYCGPKQSFPSSGIFGQSENFVPLMLVIGLIAFIHVLSVWNSGSGRNCNCHPNPCSCRQQ
nr:triple gene block 2 [Grapevine rupestris stem pitting-associated virus]